MSAFEFEEWKVFLELEPHGADRDDVRMANAVSQILAGLGVKAESRKIEDLVLRFKVESPIEENEAVEIKTRSALRLLAKGFDSRAKKGK